MPHRKLWDSCLEFFKEELPPQQYNSWIKPLLFEVKGNQIVLTAPNGFTLKVIQERFLSDIAEKAQAYFSAPTQIELQVAKKSLLPKQIFEENIPENKQVTKKLIKNTTHLNPTLLFENFVTGKANQLAHAAAFQVADSPGTTYNPLFIYGGVGLGKTHLIQAIGNQFKKDNIEAKVCYVHATNYVTDVVRAFQTKQFDQFKQYYNSLDLLLIDDIQFIADKPGTQQEF